MWRRAGSEVTISYGPWPNEVFYLFFGFVPKENPFDMAVLFQDLEHLVAFHDSSQVELTFNLAFAFQSLINLFQATCIAGHICYLVQQIAIYASLSAVDLVNFLSQASAAGGTVEDRAAFVAAAMSSQHGIEDCTRYKQPGESISNTLYVELRSE